MSKALLFIAGAVAAGFGLITIFAGGSVILDLFGMRERQGNYVDFVVWTNVICGFLYLISSYGFFTKKKWTSSVLKLALAVLIGAFLGLLIWAISDKVYETKTIVAMTFRTLVTLALFFVARRLNK